jgi:CHAT domain-containing protein
MAESALPHIETRCVCIATRGQATLAAVVSSHCSEAGVYFPVFEFPSIDVPYSPSSDFGKDGYFGRILGDRAAHEINNSSARLQPDSILLVGMTENQKSHLRALLPAHKLIEINSLDDVPTRLPFSLPMTDPMRCRASQLNEGLLLAKFSRKPLLIDESAPLLPTKHLHGGVGVLLIENDASVPDVAAINYGFAINADIVLVPATDKNQVRSLPRQLEAWSKDKSHHEFAWAKRAASKRLREVNFVTYKFATFFTKGLPYRLFIGNIVPCSHVMKELDCGLFITNALIEEHAPIGLASAIVFSPELFASEETEDISNLLDAHNYTVTSLVGKNATVKQLTNYGSHFPYDLMHICAHGGETDGYFAMQEFTDRNGKTHKLEFYEVVGFSPTEHDMVTVHRKLIFKSLDGFPWMSPPLKSYPHYVFEDMMVAMRHDPENKVLRIPFKSKIALSCHIQCADSIHQGDFNCLAGFGHPFVFNNTCSSSHEIALTIIHAGARSYIGTLWSVGNETAKRAAKAFYENLLQQGNLLSAFFEMNKAIINKQYENVYIFWGLHLSTLPKASVKSDARILADLIGLYLSWLKKAQTTPDHEVRHNSIPIARFLADEIMRRFTPERLKEIRGFDPTKLEEEERAAPQAVDGFSRGVSEIEIE